MTRAIRLTCVSMLLMLVGAGTALAKPTIAVLGLEVIDKSGTPTPQDTQVASELTAGLRARAKAGTGPYSIAAGSDKELIDEKLLKSCDDEKPACMSAIGTELNAEFLMYGHIEKQGSAYNVTIVLLDVKRKARDNSYPTAIPLAESSGSALQTWAKKIYAKLTGQNECTIVVKTPGVDRATILVDGAEKGNITNGVGQVTLTESKYRIAVEAQDYHRWEKGDVTCTASQATNLSADLQKSSGSGDTGGVGVGPGGTGGTGGTDLGHTGTVSHSGGGKGVWKAMAWGGLAGAAIGGGVWLFGYTQYTQQAKFSTSDVAGALAGTAYSSMDPKTFTQDKCGSPEGDAVAGKLSAFDKGCKGKSWTTIGAGLTVGFAVVGAVGFVMAYARGDHDEKPVTVSGRQKKHAPFAIVPVVSPDGGGASFAMEW